MRQLSEKVRDRASPSERIYRGLTWVLLALFVLLTAALWWFASEYVNAIPWPFEAT